LPKESQIPTYFKGSALSKFLSSLNLIPDNELISTKTKTTVLFATYVMKYYLILSSIIAVVVFADAAVAKTAIEIKSIARSTTVEIKLQKDHGVGSGVIVARSSAQNGQGGLYTLATNRHVVCGQSRCNKLPSGEKYSLILADGQKYSVNASAIKLLGDNLDLAIIQFHSNRNYAIAQIAGNKGLKVDEVIYTAGFPWESPGFSFNSGRAIAVVNKRLIGDNGGYSIIYDAATLPGMSGGGVFNQNGELVAIHGYGDRYTAGTDLESSSKIGEKIGLNRGIPVRWLVQGIGRLNPSLANRQHFSGEAVARQEPPVNADEFLIAGFNKLVEPGDDVLAGKRQAVQELSTAITLNPRYAAAYFMRAYAYTQLQKLPQAISDYGQALAIKPNDSKSYYNRARLKYQLNDLPGALSDYNQAININPKNAFAFSNRAVLKAKLNDFTGALADYAQAIVINPQYADFYFNRGTLKTERLKNFTGALSDFTQAIAINPNDAKFYNSRGALKAGELNDLTGALQDFNRSIAIAPNDASTYRNRGILKEQLQDWNGALADYSQAINLNPQLAEAYYNRGLLGKKLKKLKNSLADFDRAIVLNSQNGEFYYNRGILKGGDLNDLEGAIEDFRKAARLFREHGETTNLQITLQLLQKLGVKE
jgi:tetratricopeptide (TPR) repeat protein/S1-C subfamily serine protease